MKPAKQKPNLSEKNSDSKANQFPIVGIGASAGGLEAFEQFLSHVPQNSGMAYVVIQHLDPTQKGMLPELLQRISKMNVIQVKDRTEIKPDHVYVIPPNKTMSILNGMLHLFDPVEIRGLRLPIDFFFRSLADDLREQSIGIILSGMGSDGSIGLRAIKEKNGIVMVQDPDTAKYNSMPRSAIESVQVDIVAPADELPTKLLEFLKHIPVVQSNNDMEIKYKSSIEKIIILLRIHTGNDFSLYKKNTVYRRIERRMNVHKIDKITSYVRFLQENPKEIDILFKELMIGVTNFFRDGFVWEKLKNTTIPEKLTKLQSNYQLRAWIPGCSTGEEAYSFAIVFKEALEKVKPLMGISLQIFATDLDNEAIEKARRGTFPPNIAVDVSPERLNRFFIKTDDGYRVNTEIREMVVFAQHNITMHPPFTKLDFISCRNLLIYMDTELQNKILSLFYMSLNTEGIMLLGSSETLGKKSHLFSPVDAKLKIYKRAETEDGQELLEFPSSFIRTKLVTIEKPIPEKTAPNIQMLTDQLLLQNFAPAGILVNENGDIIYISGRTGKYLEPAVGKANLNVFAMLRDGLRSEFPVAFRQVLLKKNLVILHNLKVGTNGTSQTVNIKIQYIDKPEPLKGMIMIIFTDVPDLPHIKSGTKKGKTSISSVKQKELEEELQRTREEVQNTLEEMQTSQEELKSTNEELQSTNEELQSTNEELTSSKEEMQSLNEELQTVNAELQSKVDDFSRVNNDMKNLLNSTDIATLFLDKDLNIRRFTDQATKIFKLIRSDIGRPFTDQVSDLIYPELSEDAMEVIRTLVYIQKPIPTKDGRWFSIRIMPYRTFDDRIDGLVITFINISDHKLLEVELQETNQVQSMLLNSSPDVIMRLSTDWKILDFNPTAERFFERKRKEVINQNYFELLIPEPKRKQAEKDMIKLLNEMKEFKLKQDVIRAGGNISVVEWSANPLLNNLQIPSGMILSAKDIKQ